MAETEDNEPTMSAEEKHAEIMADLGKVNWPPEQAKICADMVIDICGTLADSFQKYEDERIAAPTYLQAAIIIADIIIKKMEMTKVYALEEMKQFQDYEEVPPEEKLN